MKKHFVLLLQITLLGLLSAYPSILPSLDPTALVSSLSLPPSCLVDQMPVEPNFDKERYLGMWFAIAKEEPEGLFLEDNIWANFSVSKDGQLVAKSSGQVSIFRILKICAEMVASYSTSEPSIPAKMYMKYNGFASYITSGGDDYWVIYTDYDSLTLTYACRHLHPDGSCADDYAVLFARHPHNTTYPNDLPVALKNSLTELCLIGELKPVAQTGSTTDTNENEWLESFRERENDENNEQAGLEVPLEERSEVDLREHKDRDGQIEHEEHQEMEMIGKESEKGWKNKKQQIGRENDGLLEIVRDESESSYRHKIVDKHDGSRCCSVM